MIDDMERESMREHAIDEAAWDSIGSLPANGSQNSKKTDPLDIAVDAAMAGSLP